MAFFLLALLTPAFQPPNLQETLKKAIESKSSKQSGESVLPADPFGKDAPLARLISEGYRRNRESLKSFRCQFTYSRGKAASLDQAIARNFAPDETFVCNWIVKGESEKLECYTYLDHTASKVDEVPETVYLRSGSINLLYRPDLKNAIIGLAGHESWRQKITPLNMMIIDFDERISPSACIQKVLSGDIPLKEISEIKVNNKNGYQLSVFDSKDQGATLVSMVIDPAVGFMPVEYCLSDQKLEYRLDCKTTETKPLNNGAWFPMATRLWLHPRQNQAGGKIHARSIKVLEVDVTTKRRDEEFVAALPKGTEVLNLSDSSGAFRLSEERRVLASELNNLVDATTKTAKNRKLDSKSNDTSNLVRAEKGSDYSYLAVMAMSLIVALIMVLYVIPKFLGSLRS